MTAAAQPEPESKRLDGLNTGEPCRTSRLDCAQQIDAIPAMLHTIDVDGRLLSVSDRWLDRLGYTRDEVLGRKCVEFFSPQTGRRIGIDGLPADFSKGRHEDIPAHMLTRSGELIDVLVSSVFEHDESGRPFRGLSVIQDISDRNHVLRAYSEFMAIACSNYIFSVTDAKGKIVRVNDAFCQLSGLGNEQLIGATHQILTFVEPPSGLSRNMLRVLRKRQSWRGELGVLNASGKRYWFDTIVAPLMGADGQPQYYVSMSIDISHRKMQELELRQSKELLSRTGEAAGVGGWQLDVATGELHWSEQTRLIHGVPSDYAPTLEKAIDFYAPEARPVIKAAVEKSMIDGSVWDLELPFVRFDGTAIWVRAVGKAELEQGRPVRLSGAFQDVSAQVRHRLSQQALHQRFSLATEVGGIGTWEYDSETDSVYWDQTMYRLYGVSDTSRPISRGEWFDHLHFEDRERVRSRVHLASKSDESIEMEFRVIGAGQRVRHLRAAARWTKGPGGSNSRLLGVNWDVTQIREMALQIEQQNELMKVTLHSIGDAVLTTDAAGRVTWMNPTAERLTGWGAEAAIGVPIAQVFRLYEDELASAPPKPVMACLQNGIATSSGTPGVLLSMNGKCYGIEHSASPIRDVYEQLLGMVLVFRDVTEQRRLSMEMVHRASHDMLTGLVNRTEFESRLSRLLDRVRREASTHAVLYIDLDQFKLVNDACGHTAGDQLLIQVGKLLMKAVRTRDTVARLGGDEFGVILEHCNSDQAKNIADQICESLSEFRFSHEDRRFRIGSSIGMVPLDGRWPTSTAVMQAADSACYAAKDGGRNRVHVWFDTDLAMKARLGEMKWASRLEQALDEDRFILFAQKIHAVNLPSNGLYAEVLVRLRDVDGSMVPPGAFLPAAERFHLASRLDRWVLRRTIRTLSELSALNGVQTLSVNLSGQSIGDQEFHREAYELLRQAGPAICSRICLEITETAAVTHIADAAKFIKQVHELGLRVSLDDFGSGASSFGYLKTLKVDQIKIDGQFIKDLLDDPLDDAAVRSFVEVARLIGAQTVAEFVDRPEVLARVGELGIHFAQGFLLHKPAPLHEMLVGLRQSVAPVGP